MTGKTKPRFCFVDVKHLSASLFLLLAVTAAASTEQPNVILVITDDQGYGDIAAHGNTIIKTPHLDGLYAQSVRLTDFHVEPCCTPTRGALMTGKVPLHNGAWGTTWGRSMPRKEHLMMPELFAKAGYRTGFFGKWHLGDNYPFRPQDRGFQEVLMHGGGGVGQTPDYWGNDYFDDTYYRNGEPEKHEGYCTDVWFREAGRFIRSNKDRPFFLYLSTNAPHSPLFVHEKYSAPYVKKGVPASRAKFYGMIENIDENMGRLMANLEKWGLEKRTILIFMTDNGTAGGGFNAGMRGKKGAYFEGGHRVPFFIRWPAGGLQGGRDVGTLSAHVDVLPTLAELCGLPRYEGDFDGRSLAPVLSAGTAAWPDRTLFVQYRQSCDPPKKWQAAVMTQRWRLVGEKQLYDLSRDPGQVKNVASEHPEVLQQLRTSYETWWHRSEPTLPPPARIVLGDARENPSHLNGFDWHTSTPWNQSHIRNASKANGHWAVDVARAGAYEIGLRRWPRELNKPIRAAVPGGKAIPAVQARLKIGEVDQTLSIGPDDTVSRFRVDLKPGPTTLQTWLIDANGKSLCGAYYVSVELLESAL